MKYLKKFFKLFVEDKNLALGILIALVLTKVALVVGISPLISSLILVILMLGALSFSLLSVKQ